MGNDNNIMKPVRYTKPAIPHYLYRHKSTEANQEVTETETEMTHVGSDTSDDTNFHYDSKSCLCPNMFNYYKERILNHTETIDIPVTPSELK